MLNLSYFFPVIILIFLFLLIVISITFLLAKYKKWPYIKKDSLMSKTEKNFFFVLKEVLEDNYLIFSKVRMADLLTLPKTDKNFYYYFNKIKSKHIDFVICDKEKIAPLLAIELDDSSHLKSARVARDLFVDKIFENAELPIIHLQVSASYDKQELLEKITSKINVSSEKKIPFSS